MAIQLRKHALVSLLSLSTMLLGHDSDRIEQRFTVFDAPNASTTTGVRINDRGEVAGTFADASQGNKMRGFMRGAKGDFTVFDAPNASGTNVSCINNRGDVNGIFVDASQAKGRDFVRDTRGNITVFDPPHAYQTFQSCINDRGEVAGTFDDGKTRGFLRDAKGNFTVFDAPNAAATYVSDINVRGEIAGIVADSGFNLSGYVRDPRGNFTVFHTLYPSSPWVIAINTRGEVIGQFVDYSHNFILRAFVRSRRGDITVIDAPGSVGGVGVSGINARGDIVGGIRDAEGNSHDCVRDPEGDFHIFDVPNASATSSLSINARREVAGILFDKASQNRYSHGFVFRLREEKNEKDRKDEKDAHQEF